MYDDYIEHYGTKGQKWGIRRYQNPDGSLTPEGKERYGEQRGWEARQMYKRGTITKEEMKRRKSSDGMGSADFIMYGGWRRKREFQRRHEKGYKAYSTIMGAIGGAAVGTFVGLKAYKSVGAAVAIGLLYGTAGGVGGYVGQKVNNKMNRVALEYGYNKKIQG